MERSHACCLTAAATYRDELGKTIVANFDQAFVQKNIARFKIAVHDAVIVQVGGPGCNSREPTADEFVGHALRMDVNDIF